MNGLKIEFNPHPQVATIGRPLRVMTPGDIKSVTLGGVDITPHITGFELNADSGQPIRVKLTFLVEEIAGASESHPNDPPA